MADESFENRLKTWLEIVVIAATGFVFLWLVAFPKSLNNWCDRGEFSECVFFGAKYEPTPEQKEAIQLAEQKLGESQSQFSEIVSEVGYLREQLVAASLPQAELTQLSQRLQSVSEMAVETKSDLSIGLSSIRGVVSALAPDGNWAVIYGGDQSLAAALHEISRTRMFPTGQVVFRKGSYRSVVLFPSRAEAEKELPKLKEISHRNDAYLVSFDNWCGSKSSAESEGITYVVCAP